jgi:hypothetical protein
MNDIVERLRVQIAAQTNCVTVKDSPSNAVVIIKQRDAIRAADEIERLYIEVANRAHSEQQYRAEIERLSDKALRFDLDQAGIEFREGIAVALVEAKAEIKRQEQTIERLGRESASDHNRWATERINLLTEIERLREDIAQWLEGQGQPGYAHEVRYWRR